MSRWFPDEPEEEFQARLEFYRQHCIENGIDPAWAETMLDVADSIDAETIDTMRRAGVIL